MNRLHITLKEGKGTRILFLEKPIDLNNVTFVEGVLDDGTVAHISVSDIASVETYEIDAPTTNTEVVELKEEPKEVVEETVSKPKPNKK